MSQPLAPTLILRSSRRPRLEGWQRATFSRMSRPLDARVDRRLDHVDHEIEEHEEQREHQDGALQKRKIALEDRRVEQKAGARPGEHGLDQDRAAEQIAEL